MPKLCLLLGHELVVSEGPEADVRDVIFECFVAIIHDIYYNLGLESHLKFNFWK